MSSSRNKADELKREYARLGLPGHALPAPTPNRRGSDSALAE
jgi:hypothetical protein